MHVNGEVLGTHHGIQHFTVGQRKGLGIAWPEPLYVKSLDRVKNIVYVEDKSDLFNKEGIITINPINIQSGMQKDGQTVIEISVCPLSNDIIGLQDLYLQLDINNSSFNTVVDEIASGLDPSGSNYITSSSYANGNLVRSGGRDAATQPTVAGASTPSTSTSTSSTTASTSGASSY